MSVWSLLIAAQGYSYDGPAGRIGFKPIWRPEQHRSFFTAAEGWGLYEQRRTQAKEQHKLTSKHGKLTVKQLVFELPGGHSVRQATVAVAGQPVAATCRCNGQELTLHLQQPATIAADQTITADLTLRRTS